MWISPRYRHAALIATAALALLVVAGCSEGGDASTERTESPPSLIEGQESPLTSFAEVYERIDYNGIVYTSLDQVYGTAAVIVDGTWSELAEGRTLYEDMGETRVEDKFAVASITVERVLFGTPEGTEAETVYLEVPVPPTSSLEDMQRVYPAGDRVIVALQEWDPSDQPAGINQENVNGGHPEGTRLMAQLNGLLYIDGDLPYRVPDLSSGTPLEVESLDEVAQFYEGER